MEFAAFSDTVGKILENDVDEVYGDLMSNEANTLRIIERVAADTRRDALRESDVWSMSVKSLFDGMVTFWSEMYMHAMKGQTELMQQKARSSTGLFNAGLTLFLALLVMLLLT